jgi:hypothetical protein
MTAYQEAIDVLMKVIDGMIPELGHRKKLQYMTSIKEI